MGLYLSPLQAWTYFINNLMCHNKLIRHKYLLSCLYLLMILFSKRTYNTHSQLFIITSYHSFALINPLSDHKFILWFGCIFNSLHHPKSLDIELGKAKVGPPLHPWSTSGMHKTVNTMNRDLLCRIKEQVWCSDMKHRKISRNLLHSPRVHTEQGCRMIL